MRRPLARSLFRKPAEPEPEPPVAVPRPHRTLRLERGIAVHGTITEQAANGRRPTRILVSIAIEGGNADRREELAERALAQALTALGQEPAGSAQAPPLPAVFSLLATPAEETAPSALPARQPWPEPATDGDPYEQPFALAPLP